MTDLFRRRRPRSTGHQRRRAIVLLLIGLASILTPFTLLSAGAQTAPLLSFSLQADGTALKVQGGDPTQLGYPQVVSSSAHTEAEITGPSARALASTQWPGGLAGNAGSLSSALGGPQEASALDYPVRAEAFAGATEEQEQAGMYAQAVPGFATATADGEGFEGDPFLSYGEIESTSTTEVLDGLVRTTATSRITDVVIGGQITIDSVITTAVAETDGFDGTATGSTEVSGMEVAGYPVRVDENGIRAGDSQNPNPADAVVQAVVDNVLSNFREGIRTEIYLSKPRVRNEGSVQEYRSGSLVILMDAGSPGSGGDGALLFGGSNAFSQASPGQAPVTSAPTTTAAPTTTQATLPPTTRRSTTTNIASPPTTLPPTTAPPTTVQQEVAAPPVTLPTAPIVERFDGIEFIMPFFILLGSLLVGRALHLFHQSLRHQAAAGCLIDGEST